MTKTGKERIGALRDGAIAIIITIAVVACASHPGAELRSPASASGARNVLWVSDIHFNPLESPQLLSQLMSHPPSDWELIFSQNETASLSSYGKDTDHRLLSSALRAMKRSLPHPRFIVISGDFFAHDFENKFRSSIQLEGGQFSVEEYAQFFAKTQAYLATVFLEQFPGTPIVPVLGNEDSPCGNYMSHPGDSFFGEFANSWKLNFASSKDAAQFANFGYGKLVVPADEGMGPLAVLALNDDYWTSRYQNRCGSKADRPDVQELQWLSRTLAESGSTHQPVWILTHTPMGVDLPKFSRDPVAACAQQNIPMMYQDPLNSIFIAKLSAHAETIRAVLAGHTHMSEFRVSSDLSESFSPQVLAPALTPIFNNNPSFEVLSVNPETFALEDGVVFSTTLPTAKKASVGRGAGDDADFNWTPNSSWRQTLGIKNLSRDAFLGIPTGFALSSPAFTSVTHQFSAGSGENIMVLKDPRAVACSLSELTAAKFEACYCQK